MIRKETLHALEFNKILNVISRFSHSDITQKSVLALCPHYERDSIEKRFGQTREIQRLSQEGSPLRLSHFQDISGLIEKVKPEGAVLEPGELALFIPVLRIMHDISVQIKDNNTVPLLQELTVNVTGFPEIQDIMERSLDSEGKILDTASSALAYFRRQISSLDRKIQKRLEEILRDKRVMPFLQDTFVTKRTGRWVIPVRMDSKGQISGVVHDVSRSGETAFLEPLEIIGLSNELENLSAEEKAEEMRILRNICQGIRKIVHELSEQYEVVIYLDVMNSIAGFADLLNLSVPHINEEPSMRLVGAQHPLLMLLKREGAIKEVVPIDLSLGGERSIMVITGPNAGGKTITIKTVGLLLLMALSGIPVPADSSSSFPLVHKILVDIGDEQSIESSLSTFSAHISHIAEILEQTDEKSVVLMDELGTGTEPSQGAALACGILNHLSTKGSLVFSTTHLMEIVAFVYKADSMVNASMEFDQTTMTPLYKIRIGDPGQSYAFDIARRYGLPESIVDFAKKMIGNVNAEFHSLLAELKDRRLHYEDALHELESRKIEYKEKEKTLHERFLQAEAQTNEMLEKAYREAQEVVLITKRHMHELLDEVKREKKRETIKSVERTQREIKEKLASFRKEPLLSIDEIRKGDVVFVRSLGYDATVDNVDKLHSRLRVKTGKMDIEVPVADVSLQKDIVPEKGPVDHGFIDTETSMRSTLNIIGLRVDEAISDVERFLNQAALAELEEVTIIHGVGTGALMKAVHQHLDGHPLINKYRSSDQSEGGRGVTVVKMR
jgi:DNA mismatch repair protein MutS2